MNLRSPSAQKLHRTLLRSMELNGDEPKEACDMGMRTLTDADVEAILNAFEKRFYLNLGKGIWGLVWKGILVVLAGVAGYKWGVR